MLLSCSWLRKTSAQWGWAHRAHQALVPVLCAAPLLVAQAAFALPAVSAAAGDAPVPQARVIVKLKAQSPLLSPRTTAMGTVPATGQPARMRALGERAGVVVQDGPRLSDRMQVAHASGISSQALARKLRTQADVEWVAVDQRVRVAAVQPDDPLFARQGAGPSAVQNQWYLRSSTEVPAATNALGAWALTRGVSNVVVAVVDTGVRFDHPDLRHKLLPGYDVISSPWIANDNTGRDSDASDVGDRLTAADIAANRSLFADCPEELANSWHGTKVAGIIGAQTDNGRGVAGIGRHVRILPVRALGRCGGFVSDVAAGIRWAAGLPVDNLPINPHPAKVINLSLGSDSWANCNTDIDYAPYREAIAEVTAQGAVVVVAAGNNNGVVNPPGNCSGVITVGGVRHDGSKSGYSAYGSEVALAAPAGNCVTLDGTCQYSMVTTTNPGTTAPAVGADAYTGRGSPAYGTSFAAPLVSGTAALMLSVNPALTPTDIRSRLIDTARTFPSPLINSCPTTDSNGSCNCNNSGTRYCGRGMLDTEAAVTAALGITMAGGTDPGQPQPGDVLSFTWATAALNGATVTGLPQWSVVEGADRVTATAPVSANPFPVTVNTPGRFTLRLQLPTSAGLLTLTRSIDIGPAPELTPQPVTAESPTVSRSSGGGGGGGGLEAGWLLGLVGLLAWARRSSGRLGG